MSDYSSIFVHSSCVSKTQLIAYVQQKLDKEETYLVESHLNDCQFCSDALDGLLETDLQIVENNLKSAKAELKNKLFPIAPEEAVAVSKNNNVREFEISKKTFTRWLAAASVLLIIGLGGYSVFSYIKSAKKELALKEGKSDGKAYDAKYSTPEGADDEIIKLNVEENDTFRRYAIEKEKKNIRKMMAEPAMTESNAKEAASSKLTPPLASNKDIAITDDETKPAEKIAATAPAPTNLQGNELAEMEPAKNVNNDARVYQAEKAPANLSKEVAKKKSAGGMKNDNFNAQRNQANYPNPINNNDNVEMNRQQEVTGKAEATLDEELNDKSPFEMGMESFNKKNYKKSISYFEKALKKAKSPDKEDIMYHLALAYEYSGKGEKASELYVTLSKSKKYKAEADQKLQEVQSKEAAKKK